ncbi:MAG: hypothetical protein N2110_01140 [Flavobacteriales bacterium]|nr:hypothetical protein [Flavobacteriales bacterium]
MEKMATQSVMATTFMGMVLAGPLCGRLVGQQTEPYGGKNYKEWFLNPDYPDSLKRLKAYELLEALKQSLKDHPKSSQNPAEAYPNVAFLAAPDGRWRTLTFTVHFSDGHYEHFGLLETFLRGRSKGVVWQLNDKSHEIQNPLQRVLGPSNWFGAIYYGVRPMGRKRYFLLGLNMHNNRSRIKVADPLYFDQKGWPKWGAPVIKHGNKIYHRFLLEYYAEASVRLNWDERLRMIVYDHLTPLAPAGRGNSSLYVPDGSYNGLKLKGRTWEIVEDVDARNPKDRPIRTQKAVEKGLFPPEKP